MTIPIVTVVRTDEQHTTLSRAVTVAYYLPTLHQTDPPRPHDPEIVIEQWPATIVYTRWERITKQSGNDFSFNMIHVTQHTRVISGPSRAPLTSCPSFTRSAVWPRLWTLRPSASTTPSSWPDTPTQRRPIDRTRSGSWRGLELYPESSASLRPYNRFNICSNILVPDYS